MTQSNTNIFTILQWNIRSINSNYDNLQLFIKQFNPDIITLSETFLKFDSSFTITNYKIIREERADGYGGLAIAIKSHIHTKAMSINSSLLPDRCQTIGVMVGNSLSVILSYFPPDVRVPESVWDAFLPYLSGNAVWLGDFNTQHTAWGSGISNPRGMSFYEFLLNSDLVLLNSPTPTRLTNPSTHRSAPDMTVASTNIARKCDWAVHHDAGFSDHFPILVHINDDALNFPRPMFLSTHRFNLRRADWSRYQTNLIISPNKNNILCAEDLLREIASSAEDAIPCYSRKPSSKYRVHWWNEEVSRAIQLRREAFTKFIGNPSMENWIEANRLKALARNTIRRTKKETFRSFCLNLSFSGSQNSWRIIKKLYGGSKTPVSPPIDDNLSCLILGGFQTSPLSLAYQTVSVPVVFTLSELDMILKTTKNSAPGLDGLGYPLYKNLPTSYKLKLVKLYNDILETGIIPQAMIKYRIIPFLKPNKPPQLPGSYRPISLAPCITKIFEKLIKTKIEPLIEKKLDDDNIFGFRRGRSTYDAITTFTTLVYEAFNAGEYVMAAFIDIKSAYDHVRLDVLKEDMEACSIPPSLVRIICKLFGNRELYINSAISGEL